MSDDLTNDRLVDLADNPKPNYSAMTVQTMANELLRRRESDTANISLILALRADRLALVYLWTRDAGVAVEDVESVVGERWPRREKTRVAVGFCDRARETAAAHAIAQAHLTPCERRVVRADPVKRVLDA